MAALATPTAQEIAVAEALSTITPPKGVRLLRFYFDSDWSGDPAIRVIYGVSKKIPLTRTRVRDLAALSHAAADVVGRAIPERFTYVTFDDVT